MASTPDPLTALGLQPLSARSVVLSLLLGAHPPQTPVRDLVARVAELEISEATLRVALTRMVAAGDLDRSDATYRLSARLLSRQQRQDAAVSPATVAYDGDWHLLVLTDQGRRTAQRQDLNRELVTARLAELREGHWLRPANLAVDWPPGLPAATTRFRARPVEEPTALAASLWDLEAWADRAHRLLHHLGATERPAHRIAIAAAMVRHLLSDPVLPGDLLPANWPGEELRSAYAGYRNELDGQLASVSD